MYIIRNKNTKEIIRTSATPLAIDAKGDPAMPKGLSPDIEILEIVQAEAPAFDIETEKLTPKTTEENGKLIKGYDVTPLSEEEKKIRKAITERPLALERAIAGIVAIKDQPIGKILYDLAVARGEINVAEEE